MSALAVDLGGSHLRTGVVRDGRLDGDVHKDPLVDRSFEAVTEALLMRAETLPSGPVGVAVAAMLSPDGRRIQVAPNLGWRDVPAAEVWANALGRDVVLLNDVDAICLGEARHGAARGQADVLCVMWGSGLGAGALAAGQPLRGAQGVAMELGHILVEPGGRRCGCGQQGCLEAYVGGHALQARVREAAAAGGMSAALAAACQKAPWVIGPLENAAQSGDGFATALWAEIAARVGQAVAHASTLLNPAVTVLGGGVLDHAPTLRAQTVAAVQEMLHPPARCPVVAPALGDAAGLLGAATYALECTATA